MDKNMQICIWCKYGKEFADNKKEMTLRVTRDSRFCPKCEKTGISSTFMENE